MLETSDAPTTAPDPIGRFVRTYGPRGLRGALAGRPLAWFLLGALGLAIPVAIGSSEGLERMWGGLGAAGVLGAALFFTWFALGRCRDTIEIYEGGLRWLHRGEGRIVPWSALAGLEVVHFDRPRRRLPGTDPWDEFRISIDGHAPIEVDHRIQDLRELTAVIERRSAAAMAARGQSHLDHGSTLLFGAAVVRRDGIAPQTEILPWRDLAQIECINGRLAVVFDGAGRFEVGAYAEIKAAWAVVEICRANALAAGRSIALPSVASRVQRLSRFSLFEHP